MDDLKPCPFCGVHLEERGVLPIFWKHPDVECFLDGYTVHDDDDHSAWNRRAAPA